MLLLSEETGASPLDLRCCRKPLILLFAMPTLFADAEDKRPNGRTHHETGSSEVCAEAAALQEMEADNLQEDPSSLYVDLRPFMDRAPISVR